LLYKFQTSRKDDSPITALLTKYIAQVPYYYFSLFQPLSNRILLVANIASISKGRKKDFLLHPVPKIKHRNKKTKKCVLLITKCH